MVSERDLLFPRPTPEEVLSNLTDFFFTESLQRQAQDELTARKAVVDNLREKGKTGTISEDDIADVIQCSADALNALTALLGLSQERFLGIVCLKTLGDKAPGERMSMSSVVSKALRDRTFSIALAQLLARGRNDQELSGRVPPFDLAKLDSTKFLLHPEGLVDSLQRLGLKGRYDAKKGRILEDHVAEVLQEAGVNYERGDIRLPGLPRDLDFVVPNTESPYVLIESGLFETTARELSDKGRVESLLLQQVEAQYPEARLVRVTDGISWRRRGGRDLASLIGASHYFLVFKTLAELVRIVRHHVPPRFFNA